MLVLSRMIDESVVGTLPAGYVVPEGFRFRVIVTDIRGHGTKVRLGFDGPDVLEFNRDEIQDRIDDENKPRQPTDKNREADL